MIGEKLFEGIYKTKINTDWITKNTLLDKKKKIDVVKNKKIKTVKNKKSKCNKKNNNIPKSIRDEIWRLYFGNCKDGHCMVCKHKITDLNFECGHNIPKSKGGSDKISNLVPICRNCNLGMGNRYTITEYKKMFYD